MQDSFRLLLILLLLPPSFSQATLFSGPIVGGSVVQNMGDVSFIAKLDHCSGIVIAPRWILTAGHCVFISTYAEIGFENAFASGTRYSIKNWFRHPEMKISFPPIGEGGKPIEVLSHDFGLLHLFKPIVSSRVSSVSLANPEWEQRHPLEGMLAKVYGWGITEEHGKLSKDLREVSLPIVSNTLANRAESYQDQLDGSMLAAGFFEGGKDSCDGDSGGPLVVADPETKKPILAGIVSWGDGCARPKKYGIYSRVSVADQWIQETIQKTDKEDEENYSISQF